MEWVLYRLDTGMEQKKPTLVMMCTTHTIKGSVELIMAILYIAQVTNSRHFQFGTAFIPAKLQLICLYCVAGIYQLWIFPLSIPGMLSGKS